MIKKVLYLAGNWLIKIYTKIMLNMSVVFHSRIPFGPKIIVANHPTWSDPFVLFSIIKHRVSIMIVDIVFKVPIFDRYIKYIDHIPENPKKGIVAFKKAFTKLKRGG